jgi:hypothetical protein
MKHLFIIALLLVCAYAHSQTEVAKPASNSTGFKRLYVGISTTQGVGYRVLVKNTNVPADDGWPYVDDYTIESRNDREKPNYYTNTGIRLGVNITKCISVETGVGYAYNSYKANTGQLVFGSQWNGNGYDPINNDSLRLPNSVTFTYAYHFISIPLAANFTFGKNKVRALITTGANFDLLLKATTSSKWDNDPAHKYTSSTTTRYSAFNLTPFLGIGIDYQISSLMSLRVMPVAYFQALHNVKGTPLTEHLYSGGINVALNFGFIEANAGKK